jgi:hypothetical protein
VLGFAAKRTIEEFAVLALTAGCIAHSGAPLWPKKISHLRLWAVVYMGNNMVQRTASGLSRIRL